MKLLSVLIFINFVLSDIAWAKRANVPGAVRTSLGMQYDNSCLTMLKRLGKSPEEFHKRMEILLKKAKETVGSKCLSRYPELNKYIKQWETQLETSVMLCGGNGLATPQSEEKLKACQEKYNDKKDKISKCANLITNAGQSYFYYESLKKEYPISKIKELFPDKVTDDYLGHQQLGVFGLSESYIISIMDEPNIESDSSFEKVIETITHELFHQTEVNNRPDHNEVELQTFDESDLYIDNLHKQNICSNNVTIDRVVLTTGLCLDSTMKGATLMKTPEMMSTVRSQCGKERACEEIFSKKINEKGWSTPLDKNLASSLCQKIFFEGTCQKFFREEEGKKYFINIKPLKEHADKVITRLESFIPKFKNEIPDNLMELLLKGTNLSTKDLEQNKCLSQILIHSKSAQGWYLSPYYTNKFEKSSSGYQTLEGRWQGPVINDNYIEVLDASIKAMDDHPYCKNDKIKKDFEEAKEQMKANGKKLFRAWLYMDLMHRQVYKSPEDSPYILLGKEDWKSKENQDFIDIIGKDIMNPYLDSRAKYHPLSPYFDCTTSPVRNNVAFFSYKEFVRDFFKAQEKKLQTCPENY